MLAGVARLAEIIADIGAALAPWPAQESTTTRLVAVLQKSPKADRSVCAVVVWTARPFATKRELLVKNYRNKSHSETPARRNALSLTP